MKTLQIGNDWPEERVGGLNRYFVELLRHLPELGVEVKGLVVGSDKVSENTSGTVRSFAQKKDNLAKRMLLANQAIREELDKAKFDLIVSHFALYAPLVPGLSRAVPLVIHFHGPWAAESDVEGSSSVALWAKQALERRIYSRGKRLIVLSRSFQAELVSRYGVAEELTRVVPGGIDITRFDVSMTREEARGRLGWPANRRIILAVRRLVRRMGLEALIDSLRETVPLFPDALLLIGGTGPLKEELNRRITDAGLEANVRLLGRIAEVELPMAYRAADMTIVPSQALEGFGMITLESLACGTPVLVTPVGGLPEVVRPFAPQCVFRDTSSKEMSSTIWEILSGHLELPSPNACRSYAVQNFAWPLISKRVQAVYDEAQA